MAEMIGRGAWVGRRHACGGQTARDSSVLRHGCIAVCGLLGLQHGNPMAMQLVVAMSVRCSAHARSPMHVDGMNDLCMRPIRDSAVRR